MIQLRPLTADNMQMVRDWRNEIPETLRTPFPLTEEQQAQYYRDVICDRRGTTRYWGFWTDAFVGYGGIENTQWENRIGEISILIAPNVRGKGYGREAVALVLEQAFNQLNLENVWGECYYCSTAVDFWYKLIQERHGYATTLPGRKYYNGKYYPSMYFSFNRDPVLAYDFMKFGAIRQTMFKEYGNA